MTNQPHQVATLPPGYRYADHLLGDLAERLADWRKPEDKHSYEWIARELYRLTEGEIDVTFSTVRNWLQLLEAEHAA